ncbi:MAG: KH domain-containing protein [Coriobacteriales bacterium]|jgi:predicted RNA-binding protein YlqC (UPF0109 family)|nr:KH domain-containing protein [Coriobacteriales bacterium]
MSPEDQEVLDLVRLVVAKLVDSPEVVQITGRDSNNALVIEVQVAPDDAGKVIGRQGRIVKSLRTLARAASTHRGGRHVEVEILD